MNIPNIVIMGVAACGKSSLGQALADKLGRPFIEGDSYHPAANIARMQAGIPLTDEDRASWLEQLANILHQGWSTKQHVVLSCSALKRRYRDTLRQGNPGLVFLYLAGSQSLIAERMVQRTSHFMPATLLDSQFRDLEPPGSDENVITLDISQPPSQLLRQAMSQLQTKH